MNVPKGWSVVEGGPELEPYNLALHEHLIAQGYEWRRMPELVWECTACQLENNDGLAYDEYIGPHEMVFALSDGTIEREARDPEFEQFLHALHGHEVGTVH